MFSRRTAIADGEFGRFSEAVRERREQGAQLLDLTQTNPTQAHIAYDWHALRRALNQAPIEMYAPDAAGDVRARQAIVTHLHPSAQLPSHGFVDIGLSERYRSERLVLTSSTSEAYTYLFKLLCDPGDVVLVPEPSYPLFEQLARYESVQLVGYRLEYDGAWHIDAESLRSGLQRRPKAVVLVTPNNPTGSCASAEELAMLGDSGIPLIVDQVFAPFVRQRASSQAGMVLETERGLVFVLDGLSKRCGLPQLKLAWIAVAGERDKVERALERLTYICDAYLSVNLVVQSAIDAVLAASRHTRDAIRERLDTNWRSLEAYQAQGWPVSVFHYQGGWSVMWRFPRVRSDDAWAYWCLSNDVLVQPGWLYDCHMDAAVVVSLLTPPDVFSSALGRLSHALALE